MNFWRMKHILNKANIKTAQKSTQTVRFNFLRTVLLLQFNDHVLSSRRKAKADKTGP